MSPEPLSSVDDAGWLQLRAQLWPHCSAAEHLEEMAGFVGQPDRFAQFIVRGPDREALGLAEASIRTDHVHGTSGSPVAYLEGLYVVPRARRKGLAGVLVQAVEEWGLARGCTELASDTQLENITSQAVHRRLGFAETGRVVCFNMPLHPRKDAA
jgi:aminoglycoside 6'-N-acetyltransferase I